MVDWLGDGIDSENEVTKEGISRALEAPLT